MSNPREPKTSADSSADAFCIKGIEGPIISSAVLLSSGRCLNVVAKQNIVASAFLMNSVTHDGTSQELGKNRGGEATSINIISKN